MTDLHLLNREALVVREQIVRLRKRASHDCGTRAEHKWLRGDRERMCRLKRHAAELRRRMAEASAGYATEPAE